MPESEAPKSALPASAQKMMQQVGLRADRMKRAGRRSYLGAWRAVATIGVIGWSVVLPMLAGIAAGSWIDRRYPSRFSWTLMLLFAGLALGCASAWARIKDHQENH
jgi:ATP synthase protein I